MKLGMTDYSILLVYNYIVSNSHIYNNSSDFGSSHYELACKGFSTEKAHHLVTQ